MNLLEVKNASKAFGSLIAVRDVSLAVKPGELRAVAAGRQTKVHPSLFGREEGLRNSQVHYGNAPAVCRRRPSAAART